jgi:hypothetical protein
VTGRQDVPAAERFRGRRGNFGSAVYARHPEHGRVIAGGDQRHAVDVLERVAGGDPEETSLLWDLAAYRARRLVQAHWPLIEKLAASLIERRELTGDEVREVLFRRSTRVKYQTSSTSDVDHDE